MNHIIDLKHIDGFTKEIELAGSYGQGIADVVPSNKTLAIEVKIATCGLPMTKFVVKENHKIIYRTTSMARAIEKYNKLP